MAKKRLDQLLVEKGLAPSREKAQALIIAGQVLVGDTPSIKPGNKISDELPIRLREGEKLYVSRGGIKLAKAIVDFKVDVENRVALDIGASTGGFTEVLLANGASKVFAIDVGHNQLAWKIRNDPRVVVKEKLNARYLEFAQVGEKVEIIVVDVSFISLTQILPSLVVCATTTTDWITLIKPQFEVGKDKVGKGGIVTSSTDQLEVVNRITKFAETIGLVQYGLIESPITGTEGNKEFLAHWKLNS